MHIPTELECDYRFYYNPQDNCSKEATYRSSFATKEGESYSLQISAPGYETVKTSFTIPRAVQIAAADVVSAGRSEFSDVEFEITIPDPAGEHFYLLEVASANTFPIFDNNGEVIDSLTFFDTKWLTSRDPSVENIEDDFTEERLIINDRIFNGSSKTLRFTASNIQEGGQIFILLKTVDEATYRFFLSEQLAYNTNFNPLAEPVQIPTNIENGFGFVAPFGLSVYPLQL